MNHVSLKTLTPGTILKVRSVRFPAVMHWGVVGYGQDLNGYPVVWHSQKSDTLRCTDFLSFSAGQTCAIFRTPSNSYEAYSIITRLRSKEGLSWHLTKANCEMVVRWAVQDKAVSDQLAVGALAAFAVVVFVAVAASQ
jgi:hypothetical protein